MKTASKNTKQTQTNTKFQTPHEKRCEGTEAKAKAPAKKAVTETKAKPATRDAFGGRIGTRMSQINVVVINAGVKGATVPEVAEKTGESASIVSAQLGWMVTHKKVATRKEETTGGKTVFRYFTGSRFVHNDTKQNL